MAVTIVYRPMKKQLAGHGIDKTQIQAAVRIAAVVQAASAILDGADVSAAALAQAA